MSDAKQEENVIMVNKKGKEYSVAPHMVDHFKKLKMTEKKSK